MMSVMNDDQIIRLFWERDEKAIRATADAYGDLCRSIARNILENESDAEECVNDLYLHLWNAIPPAKPPSLKVFACRIMRNLSLNRLIYNQRQKRDQRRLILFSEIEADLPDSALATEDEDDAELGRHISEFLKSQKKTVRKVFVRRYFFSESIQDIAEQYGYSESKVASMLFHTRNKLREYLNERGINT